MEPAERTVWRSGSMKEIYIIEFGDRLEAVPSLRLEPNYESRGRISIDLRRVCFATPGLHPGQTHVSLTGAGEALLLVVPYQEFMTLWRNAVG